MARIDSILNIVVQQGADELRLGTGRAPRMFARGAARRLALPETPDDMLRLLLGPLFSPEREALLKSAGRVEFVYAAPGLGAFSAVLVRREPDASSADTGDALAFDAVFVKGSSLSSASGVSASPVPIPAAPAVSAPPREAPPREAPRAAPAAAFAPYTTSCGPALASLLTAAVHLRATDVHLRDGDVASVRVDGRIQPLGDEAVHASSWLEGLLDDAARTRLDARGSVDLAFELEGGRFRLNIYRTGDKVAAAIRVLPRRPPTLAELRLPVPLHDLVELPHGLVILSGATGSGKSTMLAALAQEALRRRSVVVVTLEDPVEYELSAEGTSSLVRQRQVGRDVSDFATGLRDALREDPDVLIVGEMRDPETISLALTAAETGHLVLTTLHSRSAASAIERIVDAYPVGRAGQIRTQLGDSLRAVVSARLVPRARGSGRVAALEVLRATHAVTSIVREGKTAQLASVLQSSRKEGMITLERCLADLVRAGDITAERARASANDVEMLAQYMRGGSV